MSQRHLIAVGLVAVLLAIGRYGLVPLMTYDVWWHLKVGEQILATGGWLPHEVFCVEWGGRRGREWLVDGDDALRVLSATTIRRH